MALFHPNSIITGLKNTPKEVDAPIDKVMMLAAAITRIYP
jgi:hypothetical protein